MLKSKQIRSHTFKAVPRKKVESTTPGPASKIICAIHLCIQSKTENEDSSSCNVILDILINR